MRHGLKSRAPTCLQFTCASVYAWGRSQRAAQALSALKEEGCTSLATWEKTRREQVIEFGE